MAVAGRYILIFWGGNRVIAMGKRSASVKDSGSIVLGRGGVLDSIDSIVMAAPVYTGLMFIAVGIWQIC